MKSGMALSALAASPLSANAALAKMVEIIPKSPLPLYKVFFDQTFEQGSAFGAEVARRGVSVQGIDIDIGSVWMNDIEPRCKQGPVAIAGMTGGAPLFCLELLARDYAMYLIYRAEHFVTEDGFPYHCITGTKALMEWENTLAKAGMEWPAVAAKLVTSCPADLYSPGNIELLDLSANKNNTQQSLFSWVIAPDKHKIIMQV